MSAISSSVSPTNHTCNTMQNPATSTTTTPPSYKFSDLRKRQALFIDGLINAGYSGNHTTRRAVVATAASLGYPDSFPWPSWLTADLDRRTARGVFHLPELAERVTERAALGTLPKGFAQDPNTPGCMIAVSITTT
jgi:hypothetical protein